MQVYVPNKAVEQEKERLLKELCSLYEEVKNEARYSELVIRKYKREIKILEKMYYALEEKGYYTVEDIYC